MHLTDSHAHLYSEQFRPDRLEALRRAQEAGVRVGEVHSLEGLSIEC